MVVIQHRALRAFKQNPAAILPRFIKAAPDNIGKLQHLRSNFHERGMQSISLHLRRAKTPAQRVVMVEQRRDFARQ